MRKPHPLVRRLIPRPASVRGTLDLAHARQIVGDLFGAQLHAARVLSLANGFGGVLTSAAPSLHAIVQACARLAETRTHSLYRQGLYWYSYIPTMCEEWMTRRMVAFDRIVREHSLFGQCLGMK